MKVTVVPSQLVILSVVSLALALVGGYITGRFQSNKETLLLDSGVLCSNVIQESSLIFKAIEKEGLQGREHDKRRVVRHWQLHAPGIQQEPRALLQLPTTGGTSMAGQPEIKNMALFCDFENLALGVRDAKYAQFDMKKVLERLLLKGSIIVKKAYCDWERYKEFKASMHEAAFELIEIPHVRQSGKNSADIRLVVDALDLCYTKAHIDTFVILSGDSDFSPLVSKLRENNKCVIGVGVKKSTSDLLIANCDDFLFYDDLVREQEQKKQRAAK